MSYTPQHWTEPDPMPEYQLFTDREFVAALGAALLVALAGAAGITIGWKLRRQ